MTARTRSIVLAETPYRSLITFDTVATETPAWAATSLMVARLVVTVGTVAVGKRYRQRLTQHRARLHHSGPSKPPQACLRCQTERTRHASNDSSGGRRDRRPARRDDRRLRGRRRRRFGPCHLTGRQDRPDLVAQRHPGHA